MPTFKLIDPSLVWQRTSPGASTWTQFGTRQITSDLHAIEININDTDNDPYFTDIDYNNTLGPPQYSPNDQLQLLAADTVVPWSSEKDLINPGDPNNQNGGETIPAGTPFFTHYKIRITNNTTGETGFLHAVTTKVYWDPVTGDWERSHQDVGFVSTININPGDILNLTMASGSSHGQMLYSDISDVGLPVICFAGDTRIMSQAGSLPAGSIEAGMLVMTSDAGYQPVRWVGKRHFTTEDFRKSPKLRPVRITQGALGQGLPMRDLLVSRQHRILVSNRISPVCDEALVPAIKLTHLPGVYVDEEIESVTYVHLLLDQHQILYAEGQRSESLYLGENALHAITEEGKEEIFAIFPELKDSEHRSPPPARRFLKGREASDFATHSLLAFQS